MWPHAEPVAVCQAGEDLGVHDRENGHYDRQREDAQQRGSLAQRVAAQADLGRRTDQRASAEGSVPELGAVVGEQEEGEPSPDHQGQEHPRDRPRLDAVCLLTLLLGMRRCGIGRIGRLLARTSAVISPSWPTVNGLQFITPSGAQCGIGLFTTDPVAARLS